jgi:hypothetical protein
MNKNLDLNKQIIVKIDINKINKNIFKIVNNKFFYKMKIYKKVNKIIKSKYKTFNKMIINLKKKNQIAHRYNLYLK